MKIVVFLALSAFLDSKLSESLKCIKLSPGFDLTCCQMPYVFDNNVLTTAAAHLTSPSISVVSHECVSDRTIFEKGSHRPSIFISQRVLEMAFTIYNLTSPTGVDKNATMNFVRNVTMFPYFKPVLEETASKCLDEMPTRALPVVEAGKCNALYMSTGMCIMLQTFIVSDSCRVPSNLMIVFHRAALMKLGTQNPLVKMPKTGSRNAPTTSTRWFNFLQK